MAQAQKDDTVRVHYTGKLQDGNVFDSSIDRDPLEFQLGQGTVIPGFEAAVEGMSVGEKVSTTIPSDDAYGPRREELLIEVPRTQLPEDMNPKVGDALKIAQPDGQSAIVQVSKIGLEDVTLDANHPLAGEDLEFEIELIEIV